MLGQPALKVVHTVCGKRMSPLLYPFQQSVSFSQKALIPKAGVSRQASMSLQLSVDVF